MREVSAAGREGNAPVSEEYSDPGGESEIRRRAAWLLAMLALVAVLLVTLMVTFLRSGGKHPIANPSTYPTAPLSQSPNPSPGRHHHHTTSSSSSSSAGSSSSVSIPPSSSRHTVSCPSDSPCIASGDIGNAVAAINQYRQQNGQPAVNGSVSQAAQQCALSNGSDCSGSWAESQVPSPNGHMAVQKILPFAHSLLDPGLSSLEVGWAYDPAGHEFYFALIQNT